jgi:hypothetical protein
VIGGVTSVAFNGCEKYDPALNTWSSFPPFMTARFEFGAAVVLDKIYIAGGWDGTTPLSSVEMFNVTAWSFLSSSLAQPRRFCAAISFQNKLVVLGGTGINASRIEVFDPVSSTWNATSFPPMQIAAIRHRLAAVSF